jgi:hypothetical protein
MQGIFEKNSACVMQKELIYFWQFAICNRLFFDLIVIPQYLQNRPKTLAIVSDLFHIPLDQIERKLSESQSNPKFVPVRIKRNLFFILDF